MDFFYSHDLQIVQAVVRLSKVGCYRLLDLPRVDVRPVTVHPDVKRILRLTDILEATSLALD